MHLADAFIQSNLHCFQGIISLHAFTGNQTHDLGVASAMISVFFVISEVFRVRHICFMEKSSMNIVPNISCAS